jgi:hypothetical protein
VNDRARDAVFVAAGDANAVYERLCDLDDVGRYLAQVLKRRVPGAEIVDGEPDAEQLQLGERLEGRLGVFRQSGLGDLEHDLGRIAAGIRR